MRFLLLFALALNTSAQVPAFIGAGTVGQRASGFAATVPSLFEIASTNRADWVAIAAIDATIPSLTESWSTYTTITPGTSTAAFQAAIDAASATSGRIISLASGVHNFASVTLRTNVDLVGQGTNTILMMTGAFTASGGGSWAYTNVSAGATSGSTSITFVGALSDFSVGDSFWITESNASHVTAVGFESGSPTLYTYLDDPNNAGTMVRGQMCRATNIAGSTVGFTPSLSTAYATSRGARAEWRTAPLMNRFGFRNLTISNGTAVAIRTERTKGWWMTNCNAVINVSEEPFISGYWTHSVKIQHCWFEGYASGAASVGPFVKSDGWLIENNVFNRVNQAFINVGGGHHIFAYNYVHTVTNGTSAMIAEVGGHGGHPQFILMEGNVFWQFNADSVHGTGEHWTLFRNQIKARKSGSTFGHRAITIDSTNWFNSVVGCVLGYSGIVTNDYGFTYDVESDGSTAMPDDVLLYRYGFSGNTPYSVDVRAKTETLRHGVYDFIRDVVEWDSGTIRRVLPSSLYLSAKQGWMGITAWPGIGPDVVGYVSTYANAAQYRHDVGSEP